MDAESDQGRFRLAAVALQVLLGAFTPAAILSIGGVGVYSAPALLPLLWIAAYVSGTVGRVYFTILGALLAAEVSWALAWSFFSAFQLPIVILGAAVTALTFVTTTRRLVPTSTRAVTLFALAALGLAGLLGIAGEAGSVRKIEVETRAPSPRSVAPLAILLHDAGSRRPRDQLGLR